MSHQAPHNHAYEHLVNGCTDACAKWMTALLKLSKVIEISYAYTTNRSIEFAVVVIWVMDMTIM